MYCKLFYLCNLIELILEYNSNKSYKMKKCISIILMVILVTITVSAQKQRGKSRSRVSHKVERTKTHNNSQNAVSVKRGNTIQEQKQSLIQQAVDDRK